MLCSVLQIHSMVRAHTHTNNKILKTALNIPIISFIYHLCMYVHMCVHTHVHACVQNLEVKVRLFLYCSSPYFFFYSFLLVF